MEEMLRNCPFCLNEAGYEETQQKHGIVYTVYCTYCGVEMTRLNSEAAIEAWNRRP